MLPRMQLLFRQDDILNKSIHYASRILDEIKVRWISWPKAKSIIQEKKNLI